MSWGKYEIELENSKQNRSYLMYRLLNNSQIARATMGHRTRMTAEGTGTSLRWCTREAC